MPNNLKCPQCNSANVSWYDGALGYEAIRCNDCLEETDANSDNHCQRPDRLPEEENR